MLRSVAVFLLAAGVAVGAPAPKSVITPKPTPANAPTVEERIKVKADHYLEFPEYAIGVLYYRPARSVSQYDWKPYRKAQGRIPVLKGMVLRLDINPSAARNLTTLKQIYPDDLLMLNLGGMRVNDEECFNIKHLTGLRILNLRQAPITDAGLAVLGTLRNLETLYLEGSKVTDEGMRHLADKTKMIHLDISDPKASTPPRITDAGLLRLDKLTRIQHLNVSGTGVTDAGLAIVKGMNLLYVLNVSHTAVTDNVIEYFKGMTWLTDVDFSDTAITDAGVIAFSKLKTPGILKISGTKITEASLPSLKNLPLLHKLDISRTIPLGETGITALKEIKALKELTVSEGQISEAGIKQIEAARPGIKITQEKRKSAVITQ